MRQQHDYWDRAASRYAEQPIADEASYQRKLQITQEYLRPDIEVLEFGCGTGTTALVHAPYVGHILAIDISSRMIEIARAKAAAADVTNVTFKQSDINGIDADDQTFDAVLGLSILHLLEDRNAAIRTVHALLKPGGVFVSSTACLGDTQKYIGLIAPTGRFFGVMPLVRVFTAADLANSLTGAGFEIDRQWQPGKGKAVFIVAKRAA